MITEASDLQAVRNALEAGARAKGSESYRVPRFLIEGGEHTDIVEADNPYAYFLDVLHRIEEMAQQEGAVASGELTESDVIYVSFMRSFASLNGEIGTPLKQLAFLTTLKRRLGISVFLSLPAGVIGRTNRKGARGSPFAISNPFDIDPSFVDPLLPDLPAIVQYRALAQACRWLGIRFGSIVPLAILSVDCPLFAAMPDLGYWWRAEVGELARADIIEDRALKPYDHVKLRVPEGARKRFVEPPSLIDVRLRTGSFCVTRESKGNTYNVTLANAFPDPVAGDSATYTWSDVASLTFSRDTVPAAMGTKDPHSYDAGRPAWALAPLILGWRVKELGEDVFLIDSNQSVPEEVLTKAKQVADAWGPEHGRLVEQLRSVCEGMEPPPTLKDDLFALTQAARSTSDYDLEFVGEELWSFDLDSKTVRAIVGPLVFCVSAHSVNRELFLESLRFHLTRLEERAASNLYFATVANHDTMPARPDFIELMFATYSFLPRAMPSIFSGSEHASQLPVNKEFGFNSTAELLRLQASLSDEALALFNDIPIDWEEIERTRCVSPPLAGLERILALRKQLFNMGLDQYRFVSWSENCFGFERWKSNEPDKRLLVIANWAEMDSLELTLPWPDMRILLFLGRGQTSHSKACSEVVRLGPLSAFVATSTG